MSKDYNKTLNLPATEFPMRAGLPKKEPETLSKWQEENLYQRILEKNEGRPLYILHDGPPYANGDIHAGTGMNKILKDFIVRHKNMSGFCAPYIPGWDTHGLPIERQAIVKAGLDRGALSAVEFRRLCREFCLGYLNTQRESFKRLGVMGRWEDPYITLKPEYEACQIEMFGEMYKKGLIYKGLKPVYWCPHDETALAEAEIEYSDDDCRSIYVKFKVENDNGKLSAFAPLDNIYFVIWTTTTWTLPGNLAICLGPSYEYVLAKVPAGEVYIVARELVESVMKAAKIDGYEIIGTLPGSEFEYMTAKHPFIDRESKIILGNHVTTESGTGCVHTAPGHGADDFVVCKKYGIEPIVPVDSKGKMTAEAFEFEGLTTEKANPAIEKRLVELNALLAVNTIEHTYPHCWRCKEPILFRATEQWFASVDAIKEDAEKAIRSVKWDPAWGEERLSSMVRDRSDWCISRQRLWGVPIPVFYCKDCGKVYANEDSFKAVADLFRVEGADAWYAREASDILPKNAKCECGDSEFIKETDIMDVWFDSGVSHAAVLSEPGLRFPADMYLEGSDQYRGWFQSSLLTSVAVRGVAPYRECLSHGYVVDGEGRKLSKSLGNYVAVADVVGEYGADVLRLWAASIDFRSDIRISKEILKQTSEIYRKLRNTARYMLGNLNDFNADTDKVPYSELCDLDKYALDRLNRLVAKVRSAYNEYNFHVVFHAVHNFCVVDMSNFYLDVIKDRLYCEDTEGALRRGAQTVMYTVLSAITRILSPILCFTAEEIWSYMRHGSEVNSASVALNDLPEVSPEYTNDEVAGHFEKLLALRDDAKKALELSRAAKVIGSSLEAFVTIYATGENYKFINESKDILPTLFICSKVILEDAQGGDVLGEAMPGIGVSVSRAEGSKCDRCWSYFDGGESKELCPRCKGTVHEDL